MAVTMEEILTEAVKAGASDVHISAGVSPKMRVNGRLIAMSYPKLLETDTLALLVSVMTEKERVGLEERGEYDMAFALGSLGRFRLSAYKQMGSVAMAIRLIGTNVPSLEALGIPESVMELYQKEKGLILVTGPSGGGATTTLAALIDRINSMREAHIITLEKPIEYVHRHKLSIVNQREIGTDCESYADALRAAMREDADVILIGDLQDRETVTEALEAAETGHLVLASMHTSGAADAVNYMMGWFPENQQEQIRIRISEVLEAVVFQKLLPDKPQECRMPAFELLYATQEVRKLIREGRMEQLLRILQKNI